MSTTRRTHPADLLTRKGHKVAADSPMAKAANQPTHESYAFSHFTFHSSLLHSSLVHWPYVDCSLFTVHCSLVI
jgi:hypothetical protein